MLKRPSEMEDVPQKMTLRDKLTLSNQILAQTLVDQLTASEAFQLADFNIPKNHSDQQNRTLQSKWFSEFPWLHYNEQSNSVLCFICMQQNARSNLQAARSKEVCFISKGFFKLERGVGMIQGASSV